jgi:hypothetical protein
MSAPVKFWVCWSHNCRGAASDQLYILHAVSYGNRTLCGVRIQEIGEPLNEANSVGCKKCQRIMSKATVLAFSELHGEPVACKAGENAVDGQSAGG